jgi:sulfopyruvate decarboxylase TPP-binding subunit
MWLFIETYWLFCLVEKEVQNFKMSKDDATITILAFSAFHAFIAFILANTVIGDSVFLSALTVIMIIYIGTQSGHQPGWEDAVVVAFKAFGSAAGIYIAGKLLFWLPGLGNMANAVTTFTVTQVIGWTAYYLYNQVVKSDG